MFASLINTGPNGNNHFYSHAVKFIYHGFWIRPVGLIKFPVPLHRPVKEIDNNAVDRYSLILTLMCSFKDFLLGAVTKLALPKPHQILRHFRTSSGYSCIVLQKTFRRIGHSDPIVHLLCGLCHPFSIIHAKCCSSNSRIIP